MIHLERITDGNVWRVLKLAVADDQRGFVATNTESIVEAYLALSEGRVALPYAIYNDDEPVGFVMFGYGSDGSGEAPSVAAGNYCLWRFMIDASHQHKGYGREAFAKAMEFLQTKPCGDAELCWLSYEPGNTAARALYLSFGFEENGELCGDETVAVRKL